MKRWHVLFAVSVAGFALISITACSSLGPTSVTVGPPASSDVELSCTNRQGVSLSVGTDARGEPTVEAALANPPSQARLPGGALVASKLPSPPNTYLLTRDGQDIGTVEVSPVNGGWLVTGLQTCN